GGQAVELFTVGELDRVWVLADLHEIDIARVKVGAPARVTVVAYKGKPFEGKVDWVSGTLEPATRTARVRCTFDNPEKLLKPEMFASVRIAVEQKRALAVPKSAILRLGGQPVAFVEAEQKGDKVRFERIPLTVDES